MKQYEASGAGKLWAAYRVLADGTAERIGEVWAQSPQLGHAAMGGVVEDVDSVVLVRLTNSWECLVEGAEAAGEEPGASLYQGLAGRLFRALPRAAGMAGWLVRLAEILSPLL